MDHRKLDAALAAALEEPGDPAAPELAVFVHTDHPLGAEETGLMDRLGVSGATPGRNVFTATLSRRAIDELSEQPWVQSLRLSRKLRLLR